jgi:hypothetical protein
VAEQGATEAEGRELAEAVRTLVEWAHATAGWRPNEVSALVQRVLGDRGAEQSVVTRQLPPFEHVNLQVALDAWSAEPGRSVEVRGIAVPPHHGGVTLQQLVTGEALPPLRLSAPGVVDLPDGPGSTRACLRLALLLVTDADGRYAVLVQGPAEHQQELTVEVGGLPVERAQRVLGELDRLRSRLDVYRRQLLEVTQTPMGGVVLTFLDRPATAREDVVLPPAVLDRIERHALGVAEHREALAAAGQHLKRGLLLYGPPGTGKTHTAGYLLGRMEDYTRLLLTGRSLGAIGAVAELARDLEPAVLVLEDVDLVAADRSFGPGGSPVLFELLDAMDGAAPDADLLFVLTTNRADLLEPALAARPGRVDVAVEVELPDADARRRLLQLYGRDVPLRLSDADLAEAVERSEGVTASFVKELLRRAVLEALRDGEPLTEVTREHLARALDELLDAAQSVTRTLLGVGVDPATLPAGPPAAMPGRAGWMPYPGRGRYP